jgi:hypothetical protein
MIKKNKANETEFQRSTLVLSKKELEDQNSKLAEELKKEKGKVIYISTGDATIQNSEPSILKNKEIKYPNGVIGLSWLYDTTFSENNSRLLAGETKFKIIDSSKIEDQGTKIINDNISMSIVTGLEEENKNLKIFIRSNYPGFKITKLDGAIIDPQKSDVIKSFFPKKKWGIGPSVTLGVDNNLKPAISVGVSISYNLINF